MGQRVKCSTWNNYASLLRPSSPAFLPDAQTQTRYNHPSPLMHVLAPSCRTLFLLTALAAPGAFAQAPQAQTTQPQTTPAPAATPQPPVAHKPRPATTAVNLNLIVLDPAHGGQDNGAQLPGSLLEKDVTLALAQRLRTLLQARGFSVLLTRENSTDDVPPDARVEQSNRAHPLACLLLHAATGGHGVHLYTSSLTPLPVVTIPGDQAPIAPWDTAQLAALTQSARMVSDLTVSLNGIRVPLVAAHASVRPIDSLSCPAVALEIAPVSPNGDINTPVSDPNYQQHVAEAVTQAMVFWRGHAESAAAAAAAAANSLQTPSPSTTTPPPPAKPRPKPRPIVPPVETPDILPATPPPARKPAPIVRVPPSDPTGAAQ